MSAAQAIDAVTLAVLASRFDMIVQEMKSILQRAAVSPGVNMTRDLSCSVVTAGNELLAAAEGLPVHIYGSHLQSRAMTELHDNLAEGDAFLHNDPYLGNSHPADHTILVPVFVDGRHMFTTCAKAHLSDIGNALPTTYMPTARDVYEEGALIFPCVRIQRAYHDVEDIVRMCRSRIRVPEQWYGDYQAMLGAARVGERRLREIVARYGRELIERFIVEWFNYSERRVARAIERLPAGHLVGEGAHDPFPGLPDGFPLGVAITVRPNEGTVEVDLRDNVDCVPAGLNQSIACATSCGMQGVFNVLEPDIPHNAGSFRRVSVLLRENCVVGIPRFPHSCSMATSNPANRLINLIQSTFAQFGDGWGLAEGGPAQGVPSAVVSGKDPRRGGARYVGGLTLGNNGGPASPVADGWVTYKIGCIAGLLHRNSIEIAEQRFPIVIERMELVTDTGGAGRFRGAPGQRVAYAPLAEPITITYPSEGNRMPGRGVRGGHDGNLMRAVKIDRTGREVPLPNVYAGEVQPGESVMGIDCGGGGYGDPLERDPARVLRDVLELWVSRERAEDTYGVVFTGDVEDDSLAIDARATAAMRRSLRGRRREPAVS